MSGKYEDVVNKLKDEIKELENKKASKIKKKRDELIINSGLYEKEFAPVGANYDLMDYPFKEWDEKSMCYKYYKKNAIDITAAEYMLIEELLDQKLKLQEKIITIEEKSNNEIASLIKGLSISIYILFFIIGCIYFSENLIIGIGLWLVGFFSGSLILGTSEIIKLLHQIYNKISK